MAGAGSLAKNDLNNAGKGSEEVLEAMRSEGKNIMQEQSYVIGDAIYCVYNADSEELVREQKQNQEELKATDNYWIDTIFNTVKVNFQNLGNFISLDNLDISPVMLAKPIYKYQDLYEIDKDMKLEPEIFNYVDHPYFSILIRVKEISN